MPSENIAKKVIFKFYGKTFLPFKLAQTIQLFYSCESFKFPRKKRIFENKSGTLDSPSG